MPVLIQNKINEGYSPIDFPDPIFLITTYNDDFRKGKVKLYDWQIETLLEFSREDNIPKRMVLCANNGSGKSQIVVSPSALWICMKYPQTQVVITSASGDQIDNQVCRALNNLCRNINTKHAKEIWKINYRRYECLTTGSIIDLYATDDPGKAEGYHPISVNGMFAIIVDEAKSVSDEIFKSIGRCTGWTHRLDVSSPGIPSGYFYREFTSSDKGITNIWRKRVTYKDCGHIREQEAVDSMNLLGENFYRSAFLSEFVGDNDNVIMTIEDVNDCVGKEFDEEIKLTEGNNMFAGIDLASGGDETVVSIFKGNNQIALETMRERNAIDTVTKIISILDQYEIKGDNVNVDDGGLGRPMIDMLWEKGYNVNRVLNQSASVNKLYGNKGAEIWFNFSRWVKDKKVSLLNDNKLITQLSSRRYTRAKLTGKIILESKEEIRKKNGYSPDRADATVLAFAGKSVKDIGIDNDINKDKKTINEVIEEVMLNKLYSAGDVWLHRNDNNIHNIVDIINNSINSNNK